MGFASLHQGCNACSGDAFEHELSIVRRAYDNAQHLCDRRPLVTRLLKFAGLALKHAATGGTCLATAGGLRYPNPP